MNTAPRVNEQADSNAKALGLGDTDTQSILSAEFDRLAAGEDVTGESHEEEEEAPELDAKDSRQEEDIENSELGDEKEEHPQKAEAEEQDGEPPAAPERWPDDLKEYYSKLDNNGKRLLLDKVYKPMQRAYTQSTQEIAQMRKTLEPMLNAMSQYRNEIERMGVSPEEAFRTQMAWAAHFSRVGAEQGIRDMQSAYGLNGEAGKGQEEYLTPSERKLKAELDGLKQQVTQTSSQTQSWQEQQNQKAINDHMNGIKNELVSFVNEQIDGKPAHPHMEKVAPAIAGILRSGLVSRTDDFGQPVPIKSQLAQAYQMACRLDPSIRTAQTSERQVRTVKNAQDADVVTKTPAGQETVPSLSVTEQLEENYNRLSRR